MAKIGKDIKFDDHNANMGTEEGAEMLDRSIEEFGFIDPGVLDKDGVLVGGNKRTEAAMRAGMEDAIIIEHDGKTPIYIRVADLDLDSDDPAVRERSRRAAYMLNKSGAVSLKWNPEVLSEDAFSLNLSGIFKKKELPKLKAEPLPSDSESGVDITDSLVEKWDVQSGQLWRIGRHRLYVGDCTSPDSWSTLLFGVEASDFPDITFTSPPYNLGKNVNLRLTDKYKGGSAYGEDEDALEGDAYLQLLIDATSMALANVGHLFMNLQSLAGNKVAVIEYLYEFRKHLADQAVWVKSNPIPAMHENVMNAAFEHVFVLAAKENPTRSIATGDFRGTVDNVYISSKNNSMLTGVHGAAFPTDFVRYFLGPFCQIGVVDPFCGTGTTIIAAHLERLIGYGIEKSPKFAAIALERFEKELGIIGEYE